ncbi:MAG: hypothetical protein ACOY3L_04365 [Pseudomonadota bacterium]
MKRSPRHELPLRSLLWFGAAALATLLTLPGGAAASPQALGIVASNGHPTPLLCDAAGECRARFSAFCLQQAREAPPQGTLYRLADGSSLTLIVTRSDGRAERLPATPYIRFESQFGFTSVEAVLPAPARQALDAETVALEVGPAATLLPVEAANDPDPQSPEEIALATGPLRAAASRLFEAPGPAADAARLTTLAINALPPVHEEETAALDRLWARTVVAGRASGLSAEGIAAAEAIWQSCQLGLASQMRLSMRECLELRHTDLMTRTNRQFWEETGGS